MKAIFKNVIVTLTIIGMGAIAAPVLAEEDPAAWQTWPALNKKDDAAAAIERQEADEQRYVANQRRAGVTSATGKGFDRTNTNPTPCDYSVDTAPSGNGHQVARC
ncbi:MAG: hypothetical protein ACREQV_14710 [Candidatus Binatia bacterium]